MNRVSNGFFPMVLLAMTVVIVTLKCNITITTGTPESITQEISDYIFLKSLTLTGGGFLDNKFMPNRLEYTYKVPHTTKSIKLTPKANSKKANITINGNKCRNNQKSEPIPLKVGTNEIVIQVAAENSDERKYTIVVEREAPGLKSDDNFLKSLTLSGNGSWDPRFEPNILNYTYKVQNTVKSITLIPGANNKKSKITINGKKCTSNELSEPISLTVGKNKIVIKVTAENGDIRNYTIMVERSAPGVKKSGDNFLKSLVLSGNGSWNSKFEQEVFNYTYEVQNTVKSITITPGANSNKAKITINGKVCRDNQKSEPISLKVGTTVIVIQVTAENGDIRKYTITVQRLTPIEKKSDDNSLKSLILSGNGSWDRQFKPDVYNYTYKVPLVYGSITLTPNANSNKSKITVNGKECKSNKETEPISLKIGKNEIIIQVTAENGDVQKYIVIVERLDQRDNDNSLKSLILSGNGLLDRKFKPDVVNYIYRVSNKVESITLTPGANSEKSKITINGKECGSNEESAAISLKVGTNVIVIQVTAENGDARKYTVNVRRLSIEEEKDDNTALSSLTITGASFQPDFNPYILKYKAFVHETKVQLNVKAVAESKNATIILKLDGKVVDNQQNINITGSKATLVAEVTAGNGTTRISYTVFITKILDPIDANLRGIEKVEKGETEK